MPVFGPEGHEKVALVMMNQESADQAQLMQMEKRLMKAFPIRNFILTSLTLVCLTLFPAMSAADSSSTSSHTTGSVTVMDVGSFDVTLCESTDFGTVSVTSSQGTTKNDRTKICYFDDSVDRFGFTVTLSSSDFVLQDSDDLVVIPAQNLSIWRTSAPIRTSLNGCPLPVFDDRVGLIYATRSPADMVVRTAGGNNPSYTWPANDLSTGQLVGRGEPGMGTGVGCATSFGDVQAVVALRLFVPSGQTPGTYKAQLTLDVEMIVP